ncbi:MAG: hypothetical protein RLZZ312_1907 [Bacteroidota bacterium]
MNKLKFLSIALFVLSFTASAQDLESAKKAIDAEQFEKAKGILKGLVASKPDIGKNYFFLGNVYLTQKLQDSAAASFNKGLLAKTETNLNNIGLGQIELDKDNAAGAKALFDKATLGLKKKEFEEFLYIGRAYMGITKPDYGVALTYLSRAKAIAPNDAQILLSLGDTYYGVRNNNDAFSAYRDAYDADKNVLRAKLQLARITKEAKAFPEALAQFEAIKAINPMYGPDYREMAETYFLMALNDKDKYAEYNRTALEYYDKYMSMTDYSLDSRMRHADFLMLTKDYKALEIEANEMQKLDKVNPRIFRYLGYSAYQTGNFDGAINALNDFLAAPKAKIIGRDYLYLGLAKNKKSLSTTVGADGKNVYNVDQALFSQGVADLKKGVELDPVMANELNDFGKIFFDLKLLKEAASIYEVATLNPNSRNYLFDSYYYAYSTYFDLANQKALDLVQFDKAQKAFSNVITIRPSFVDAYIYKARLFSLKENDPLAAAEMAKYYEEFEKALLLKGDAEVIKPANQKKLVEANNNIAVYHLSTDKAKAKFHLEKVLKIDATNEDALANIKFVK